VSAQHRKAAIQAADQAAAKEKRGPVASLLANAADQLRIAHQMAAASEPGGEEATGVSKALSERDVEEIAYQVYAERMGITERGAR
jgi:hypothetical protein